MQTKNRVSGFGTVPGMGCQGMTGRQKDRATTDDLLTRPCILHKKLINLSEAKTVKIRQLKKLFRCEVHTLTGIKIDQPLNISLN